ncbi:MAG: hypothetical protein ABI678_16455 [Kofleriaceae bacterium]
MIAFAAGRRTLCACAWVDLACATYRLDCDAMEELWQAYCAVDYEPDASDVDKVPNQTAAALQDKMQAQMKPLLAQLPPLLDRAKKLVSKKETKSRGANLIEKLEKEQKRLSRLSVQGTWRGSCGHGPRPAARITGPRPCPGTCGPSRTSRSSSSQ